MAEPLRIFLVDDHETVRHGLRRLVDDQPDMTVVGEASDGVSALEQVGALTPDVVVLDLSMLGMGGLAAARELAQRWPDVAIVVLTRHAEEAYLEELLRVGASDYVLKQSPSPEFLQAIRVVATGGRYLDSAMTRQMTDELLNRNSKSPTGKRHALSNRESEVLRMVAVGHSNKEVAAQLGLSVKTVEVHKAHATKKLSLKGRVDIVRYASLQGWLHDS